MGSLVETQREGALMRSLGVRFEAILNYQTAWTHGARRQPPFQVKLKAKNCR